MPTTGSPVRASTPRSLKRACAREPGGQGPGGNVRATMTLLRRTGLREYLRGSWRILLKELSAFGLIGAVAFVLDLGIFALLQKHGALKANCASTVVSTAFAYVGNRYLSFSHRARTSLGRETAYFFGIN